MCAAQGLIYTLETTISQQESVLMSIFIILFLRIMIKNGDVLEK